MEEIIKKARRDAGRRASLIIFMAFAALAMLTFLVLISLVIITDLNVIENPFIVQLLGIFIFCALIGPLLGNAVFRNVPWMQIRQIKEDIKTSLHMMKYCKESVSTVHTDPFFENKLSYVYESYDKLIHHGEAQKASILSKIEKQKEEMKSRFYEKMETESNPQLRAMFEESWLELLRQLELAHKHFQNEYDAEVQTQTKVFESHIESLVDERHRIADEFKLKFELMAQKYEREANELRDVLRTHYGVEE